MTRSILSMALALVVGVVTLLGGLGGAYAESGSVRYSYDKVEIGDVAQWVLVPVSEESLRGEVMKATILKAFDLLREDKGSSYGNSSISMSGSVPEGARVEVKIDPDYSQYKLIIMAETVYTLTELGIDKITFPGYAKGNVTRADIPFSAYTPSLPLWRAVPPANLVDAQIRLPNGEVIGFEQMKRRWQNDDPKLVKAIYTYLDADQPYTVISVLERIPKLEIAYAREVIPLLEHDVRRVRASALEALGGKRNQKNVLSAVLALMEREDNKGLAEKAAKFLGKADSARFSVQEQFFYLERGNEDAKIQAAKKLADATGDERVVERLSETLTSDKKAVTSRAADSLLALDAYEALIAALENEEIAAKVRMQIARGLTKEAAAKAKVAGYTYIGNNAEGRDRRVAVRSLAEIGTNGARKAAESFLTAEDRRVRLTAIETVEKIGSPKSLKAIADAVRADKSAAKIESMGYRIMKQQPVQKVLDKTLADDTVIQRMAYRAVGKLAAQGQGSEVVFEQIKRGAKHRDASIRGAAARALGAFADERSLKILKTLADDKSATVRRDVAYALGNYEEGKMTKRLVGYLDDNSPKVVAAALSSLIERDNAKPWDKIVRLTQSDSPLIRQHAYRAMSQLADRSNEKLASKVVSRLSGVITSDDSQAVIRTALEQLGTFERKGAVTGIALKLNAREKDMRLTSIEALGGTGHPEAADLLIDTLSDPDPEIRRAAIEALGRLGDPKALPALNARLKKEKNKELKKLIQKTIEKF